MTWVSHSVVTFTTMFVATHNVFIAGSAMLGSTFPDRIEGPLWRFWHRSYSHWFVFYLVAIAILWTPDALSFNGVQLWQNGMAPMIRSFLFSGLCSIYRKTLYAVRCRYCIPQKGRRFCPGCSRWVRSGKSFLLYCIVRHYLG